MERNSSVVKGDVSDWGDEEMLGPSIETEPVEMLGEEAKCVPDRVLAIHIEFDAARICVLIVRLTSSCIG